MNILLILLISIAAFFLAYRFYARYIEKIFKVDSKNITPAKEINDGVDYIPTKKFVIFGHHFSSIAGGGPIIGPTVALIFGYLPVWLWIIFGTIFLGAAHDFSALLASLREKGKSMAEIAEKTLGRKGFLLFISFTVIMLLMVTSVFLVLTTTALASKYPVSYFGENTAHIQTVVENGIEYAVIGGIASTSVIVITFMAPLIGFLLYKKKMNLLLVSSFAISVCIISIPLGFYNPLHIDSLYWMIILSIYSLIAAGIPVWIVLQPRDFINSFLLYGGLAGLVIAAIVSGIQGGVIDLPLTNIAEGNKHLGLIWPILFITVACGAISGFHALVAGGTTSKQLENEKPDAKTVAYGGMVLEAILAVGVIIALGFGLDYVQYTNIVFPTDPAVKSNPILAFALGMGGLINKSFGLPIVYGTLFGILMVEGFVVTTLDTAVRLNRYLLEELWQFIFKKTPKILKTYLFNSFLCVLLMFLFAYFNAFKELWQLFGSANQLLAGLTLTIVAIWLLKKGSKFLFVFLPGIFMIVTSVAALVIVLFKSYLPKNNYILIAGDLLLIFLTVSVIVLSIKTFLQERKKKMN